MPKKKIERVNVIIHHSLAPRDTQSHPICPKRRLLEIILISLSCSKKIGLGGERERERSHTLLLVVGYLQETVTEETTLSATFSVQVATTEVLDTDRVRLL